jgi:hypothetical protein
LPDRGGACGGFGPKAEGLLLSQNTNKRTSELPGTVSAYDLPWVNCATIVRQPVPGTAKLLPDRISDLIEASAFAEKYLESHPKSFQKSLETIQVRPVSTSEEIGCPSPKAKSTLPT